MDVQKCKAAQDTHVLATNQPIGSTHFWLANPCTHSTDSVFLAATCTFAWQPAESRYNCITMWAEGHCWPRNSGFLRQNSPARGFVQIWQFSGSPSDFSLPRVRFSCCFTATSACALQAASLKKCTHKTLFLRIVTSGFFFFLTITRLQSSATALPGRTRREINLPDSLTCRATAALFLNIIIWKFHYVERAFSTSLHCIRVHACVSSSCIQPCRVWGTILGLKARVPPVWILWIHVCQEHGTPPRTFVVHGFLYDVVPTEYFEVLLTWLGACALLWLHFQNTEKLLTEYIEGPAMRNIHERKRLFFPVPEICRSSCSGEI